MHDLIIIGDDLSSHVAAAVAANYGLDTVLVAEHGLGGFHLVDDFAFNIDPTPLSGFGLNQTCLSLLAELDIPPIERESKLLNPAYQIILPEHRIDFFNEQEALVNEMAREFPEYALEIKSFYESAVNKCNIFTEWLHNHPHINPLSFKDYYIFFKMLPSLFRHQLEKDKFKKLLNNNISLKKVFEAQEALLSINTDNQNSFSSSLQHCTPFRGIYYFRQGKQILFNSLVKKLESKNGLYLSNCEVLSINKGKSISIDISANAGNTSSISAKYLIVSTKWDSMHLLLAGKKKINFEDWINPVKISHSPFTIHLGCARNCLPDKMAHHLAVVSDVQKNIFDNNMIILEYSMPDDETISANNNVPLTATVFLSADPEQWSRENLTVAASSVIDRLEYFLPFLKENIVFFDLEKSIEISKISRSVYSSKYIMRRSFITGFAARTNKTRFKNVYMTGASLLADAGFEGEIISGINAASSVIGRCTKIS